MAIFAQLNHFFRMDLLHIIAVVALVIIGVVIYINKRKNQ